jgi:1,4-dihydroxy-2-naphthoate octaprenyltransferase
MNIGISHLSEAKVTLLQVINPPIYLISILPGIAVLLFNPDSNSAGAVGWATVAVILVQHGINLLNDITDWQRGADVEKHLSWVRYSNGETRHLQLQAFFSLAAGSLLGAFILLEQQKLSVLLIAAPLLLAGYLYNAGEKPLSYTRMGEWVTAACYGPGVFGCLWWLSLDTYHPQQIAGGAIGSIAFAALAAAILLSHQPPQIETDSGAGKISFAVRHGAEKTRRYSRLLYALFCLCILMLFAMQDTSLQTIGILIMICSGSITFTLHTEPSPPKVLIPATICILSSFLLILY